ncbi:MAG: hypothetical protein AAB809_00135 [Patescibacteria group bacterium]
MKNNSQKFQKKPLILSLILLISSFLVFFFLHREIQKNIIVSEQAQTAWQDETNKRDELQSLNRLIKNIKEERALLETYFIQSSDVVPFLNMIEKLGPRVGAGVEIVLVDMPRDNSGLMVEMKVTGRFEALYKFLTLLENSPYELDFISMNMQRSGGEAVSGAESPIPMWSAIFRVEILNFIQKN